MKRATLATWGLLVIGGAACSDRGTVVGDTDDNGGSSNQAAGTGSGGAGDGNVEHAGGTDAATGGKSSGTGGRPEATGGSQNGDAGSSGTTGDGSDGTGGAEETTGGTGTGGKTHAGGTSTGGRATGGTGGSDGGSGAARAGAAGTDEATGGTGGQGVGTGGARGAGGSGAAGAAGSAGSTACTTDECCASVEVVRESLTVYLVDGQFYFDGTVELVDGPLDLNGWLATVELSSAPTGAVEGPMAYANAQADRTDWVGSPGSSGSGVECGQTLTFQTRVRTDTTLRDPQGFTSECAGAYGPSVAIQATVQCPTCPEDAQAAEYDEETCLYPVTLQCPGQTTDMSGKPVTVGCPCDLSRQPRHWTCPVS